MSRNHSPHSPLSRRASICTPSTSSDALSTTSHPPVGSHDCAAGHTTPSTQPCSAPKPWASPHRLVSLLADYGIAGLMLLPNMCWFVYNSSDYRDGEVGWTNSPFFANTYPPNSTCLYLFQFHANQSVRLSFTTFHTVAQSEVAATGGSHFHHCPQNCKQVGDAHLGSAKVTALYDCEWTDWPPSVSAH
ncbi:unnamed protein product [Hydatigera taeniaeformis]|uniref:CUB domain-containing protein n=1 Tax=Hydatigena taeniaeformis TaxID=6205 RepID=A0A0R3WWY1_HYDTA|nr:unnamed protein product [Hydatigera taeniaeformis]